MYYSIPRKVNATKNYFDDAYDYVKKTPLITLLIAICVLSNIAAVVCFWWEVGLHPESFNLVPAILTTGMFVVPQITARGRHKKDSDTKNCYDILFVLYGAVAHSMCCFAVGYAGDSPWGCSIEFWNEKTFTCDMSHPGIWGAFFFAIASITGHAFGWEKIKKQRRKENWIKEKKDWTLLNDYRYSSTRAQEAGYDKYVLDQKCDFKGAVKISFYINFVTIVLFIALGILQIVDGRPALGALYFFGAVVQLLKAGGLGLTDLTKGGIDFSDYDKSLWLSILNITVFVWLLGSEWFIIGKRIKREKDLSVTLLSTVFMTCLAFVQHFHI